MREPKGCTEYSFMVMVLRSILMFKGLKKFRHLGTYFEEHFVTNFKQSILCLQLDISMHILHSVLYIFAFVQDKENLLKNQEFL